MRNNIDTKDTAITSADNVDETLLLFAFSLISLVFGIERNFELLKIRKAIASRLAKDRHT